MNNFKPTMIFIANLPVLVTVIIILRRLGLMTP
jgi:hypothetical protein